MSLRTLLPGSKGFSHVIVAGAGIVGVSIALELRLRGHRVTLLDTAQALRAASSSAAGMLAADDPHNPPALHEFAAYSLSLYTGYLLRLASLPGLSRLPVPFQTDTTLQYDGRGNVQRLREYSIDPRQLAAAARVAAQTAAVEFIENAPPYTLHEASDAVAVTFEKQAGVPRLQADIFVHAAGAWPSAGLPVHPVKGQMLRVQAPPGPPLTEVHRSEQVYVVPRTLGPQAGTVLIGATLEHAGYDTKTHLEELCRLRTLAARLVPALADEQATPMLEAWAGLRPATPDLLPIVGALTRRQLCATGHFRNGILLAPGTAAAVADLIEGRTPATDLAPFSAARFRTL